MGPTLPIPKNTSKKSPRSLTTDNPKLGPSSMLWCQSCWGPYHSLVASAYLRHITAISQVLAGSCAVSRIHFRRWPRRCAPFPCICMQSSHEMGSRRPVSGRDPTSARFIRDARMCTPQHGGLQFRPSAIAAPVPQELQ